MDVRTFIAIELEPSLQQSLHIIQNQLKPLGVDVRWIEPQDIHITLKFLGEIPSTKVKTITEIFPRIFQGIPPFEIELAGLDVFPLIERPTVLWVGINQGSEETRKLAAALEETLYQLGYPKEGRKFTPHLTLGRIKSLKNCGLLAKTVADYKPQELIRQTVNRISFFKSTLSAHRSIYEPLATAYLK